MKPYEEQMLFEHPLNSESLVVDVGGHDGNFCALIHEKFRCSVHCYEPLPEFYDHLVRRFTGHRKIHLHPYALGNRDDGMVPFGVKGAMSGEHCAEANYFTEVKMRDFIDVLDRLPKTPDLISLNCEGGEFQILEYAIESGLINTLLAIQVQPHTTVPDYQARWDRIMDSMQRTHVVLFDAPWCWVGWRRRE